jgi:hypothetical protein
MRDSGHAASAVAVDAAADDDTATHHNWPFGVAVTKSNEIVRGGKGRPTIGWTVHVHYNATLTHGKLIVM